MKLFGEDRESFFRLRPHVDFRKAKLLRFFGLATTLVFLLYAIFASAPASFPAGKSIIIPKGATLAEVVSKLQSEHVVRYSFILRMSVVLLGDEGSVHAGTYQFHTRKNVFRVARAIMTGNFGLELIRVTIPEGATARDIADLFSDKQFPAFDRKVFLAKAAPLEGYLFPDTYLFLPTVEAEEVVVTLRDNFSAKLVGVRKDIYGTKHSLRDIVTMASLLEREARSTEVRRMIAGILWKRIEIGMFLQVDAVFGYIKGKDTYSPSLEDLTIDSPYNTYRNKGLPPGPISNPGLDAMVAAATPVESKYLYYLTDQSGVMRYAVTYEEHLANKQKYLQ
ncbi:hypothetical protein A2761_00480 [Candidatus Kaiserbacteria bacterium RIFCSPHIGHO2_01_FULL_51_33]|uniref:Endolytic murein transglycosylase n=1 Tax=Candidatus Kaiserbacteria bacterium RIFCSPLOWO2_01_FULL_51_21 TaxID=1798508 RepID=A0A1F6EDJ3_9BACT|nr:MAG: hypothetical protein A2761_00480 [Candidatus Kaiserbacteria bacterium RIFCSPHIGHO2_01_FULL_51_33]OGG71734.1 MAG: hypothetical protein A3A35_01905 [Candidatus Kaiserbacteria bacterium RIFCSPLOWO2_01_FULL_51_21]